MKAEKIYFNPNEIKAVTMGLALVLEDFKLMKDQKFNEMPWTPEARQSMREIVASAHSAAAKIEKFTGIKSVLPPYKPGDEDELLTKES